MRCLNTGENANFSQANNVWEIADGPEYNWCNVTALVMGWAAVTPDFDSWKNPFGGTHRIQPEDWLAEFFRDPKNFAEFMKIRPLDLRIYPPERVPQYHPLAVQQIFGLQSMFSWGTTFDLIASLIAPNRSVELCLKSPGHYVLANAFENGKIGFKDPAPEVVHWKAETLDSDGNKWFGVADMNNIESFYVTIERVV